MKVSFTNLNDLLGKVKIMIQQGDYPFSSCSFTHSELKALLDHPKCDEIIFFPVHDLNTRTGKEEVTLLAVGVDQTVGGRFPISPAVLGDCPPRCKEDTDKGAFKNQFIPKITVETKTPGS